MKALGVWPAFRFNEESEDLALGTTTTTTKWSDFKSHKELYFNII